MEQWNIAAGKKHFTRFLRFTPQAWVSILKKLLLSLISARLLTRAGLSFSLIMFSSPFLYFLELPSCSSDLHQYAIWTVMRSHSLNVCLVRSPKHKWTPILCPFDGLTGHIGTLIWCEGSVNFIRVCSPYSENLFRAVWRFSWSWLSVIEC